MPKTKTNASALDALHHGWQEILACTPVPALLQKPQSSDGVDEVVFSCGLYKYTLLTARYSNGNLPVFVDCKGEKRVRLRARCGSNLFSAIFGGDWAGVTLLQTQTEQKFGEELATGTETLTNPAEAMFRNVTETLRDTLPKMGAAFGAVMELGAIDDHYNDNMPGSKAAVLQWQPMNNGLLIPTAIGLLVSVWNTVAATTLDFERHRSVESRVPERLLAGPALTLAAPLFDDARDQAGA